MERSAEDSQTGPQNLNIVCKEDDKGIDRAIGPTVGTAKTASEIPGPDFTASLPEEIPGGKQFGNVFFTLLGLSTDRLVEIAADSSLPVYVSATARELASAGSFKTITAMLEKMPGRYSYEPVGEENDPLKDLPSEVLEEIEKLIGEYKR